VFSNVVPQPTHAEPTQQAQTSNQLPFPKVPSQPNLIVGMVFNAAGTIVENAIVEIIDQQGMTVRAVKTNSIGQFSISSTLNNGQYSIHVEKAGYTFEPLGLNLTGQIVNPLEIHSVA
jgi:hypothetical protein